MNAEPLLARLIAAVEAMPDFAGRTTRPDGLTHRCDKCGEWMAATSVRHNDFSGVVHHERQDRLGSVKCGPVHDLEPVEGVLRSDVIATLRRVMKETP